MRVATDNKLAILQTQYRELFEQTQMLCNQLPAIQQQIASMQPYICVNNGDRKALADYNNAMRRLNSLNGQIQHNNMRLATLQRNIAQEETRIGIKLGKQQINQARTMERQCISMARAAQRQQIATNKAIYRQQAAMQRQMYGRSRAY